MAGLNGKNGIHYDPNGAVVVPFRPTDRQRHFRDMIEQLIGLGVVHVRRWLVATRDDSRFVDGPVTLMEWEMWKRGHPNFYPWLIGTLYSKVEEPCEKELMDIMFWEGLSRAMAAGQDWAFRLYKDCRGLGSERMDHASAQRELDDWLGRGGGAAWRRPVAQA